MSLIIEREGGGIEFDTNMFTFWCPKTLSHKLGLDKHSNRSSGECVQTETAQRIVYTALGSVFHRLMTHLGDQVVANPQLLDNFSSAFWPGIDQLPKFVDKCQLVASPTTPDLPLLDQLMRRLTHTTHNSTTFTFGPKLNLPEPHPSRAKLHPYRPPKHDVNFAITDYVDQLWDNLMPSVSQSVAFLTEHFPLFHSPNHLVLHPGSRPTFVHLTDLAKRAQNIEEPLFNPFLDPTFADDVLVHGANPMADADAMTILDHLDLGHLQPTSPWPVLRHVLLSTPASDLARHICRLDATMPDVANRLRLANTTAHAWTELALATGGQVDMTSYELGRLLTLFGQDQCLPDRLQTKVNLFEPAGSNLDMLALKFIDPGLKEKYLHLCESRPATSLLNDYAFISQLYSDFVAGRVQLAIGEWKLAFNSDNTIEPDGGAKASHRREIRYYAQKLLSIFQAYERIAGHHNESLLPNIAKLLSQSFVVYVHLSTTPDVISPPTIYSAQAFSESLSELELQLTEQAQDTLDQIRNRLPSALTTAYANIYA